MRKKSEYIILRETQNCPECGKKLKPTGSRTRNFRDSDGDSYTIRIRKFACEICTINFTEIPDCLEERSRYLTSVKEEAILHPEKFKGGPSDATLHRWKKSKEISVVPRNEMKGEKYDPTWADEIEILDAFFDD